MLESEYIRLRLSSARGALLEFQMSSIGRLQGDGMYMYSKQLTLMEPEIAAEVEDQDPAGSSGFFARFYG